MHSDPRDSVEPVAKAWSEFSAVFAPAVLLLWFLHERGDEAIEYFRGLEDRFYNGFANAQLLAQEDPDYDGAVPIQSEGGGSVNFIDEDEALALQSQLFPHSEPEGDFRYYALGYVLIGVHSALETFVTALGLTLGRKQLPKEIQKFFKDRTPQAPLSAELADDLTELDETRHLLVHHRGSVSARYVNNVRNNKLIEGERKPLDFRTMERLTGAAWKVADLMREAARIRKN